MSSKEKSQRSRNEFKEIILQHNVNYPSWQMSDAVKLIYQNEFGCGHFISDLSASLRRLEEEIGGLPAATPKEPLFEDLGNGFSRLYLNPGRELLSVEMINQLFALSAEKAVGSQTDFLTKLELLKELCVRGGLPFSEEEATGYLNNYARQGYPPVGHSVEYKEAYYPSYRVVLSIFAHYFPLLHRIEQLRQAGERVTLAIDGPAGSGKSTLASLLQRIYACPVISMDHFFLQPDQRSAERLQEPGGNVDYERFQVEVLPALAMDEAFNYRIYNCQTQSFSGSHSVQKHFLRIVEGSYSLQPKLSSSYNLRVFLTIEPEKQKKRLLKRNGPEMLQRFLKEWIPLEKKYFAACEIEKSSDLVFETFLGKI